jgi:3-phosphoshikimate 1-carboxyvinyltransferase
MKKSNYEISPLSRGKWLVNLPSSKSLANRCIHLAAMSEGTSEIKGDFSAADIQRMVRVWSYLGASFQQAEGKLKIKGCAGNIVSKSKEIYVGQAGTVARFITAVLMFNNKSYYIYGDEQMNTRPMKDLCESMGNIVKTTYLGMEGCLPISLHPINSHTNGKEYKIILNSNISSQFLSALIMALSSKGLCATVYIKGKIVSKSYINMTIALLKKFGGNLVEGENCYKFLGGYSNLLSTNIVIEPDLSSASYFMALAAIHNSEIYFPNIKKNSLQGDIVFTKILEKMGCELIFNRDGLIIKGCFLLQAIDVDMSDCSDLVPALCVVAMFAKGTSYIRNIGHMRYKESNRICALTTEIKKLGGDIKATDESLQIKGSNKYQAAICRTHNDHRIAMAMSIAGTKIGGVKIDNPSCIRKSFPFFLKILNSFTKPYHNHVN